MTRVEARLLRDVINTVAHTDPERWENLKYETEYGPFFGQFPYHPAAMEMWPEAEHRIGRLSPDTQNQLVEEWARSHSELPLSTTAAILNRYAMAATEALVDRARSAQARTINR